MAHIQFMDELIREYLLFRGFNATLKCFDNDLKNEKERGFRVDKIVDQILQLINNYDLVALREIWSHLENHIFCKLESPFTGAVKKLENAVLKLYLVNAVFNNKPEKVTDFFTKLTSELQNQSEWKEWFMLPYIKNPEENPIFAVHFTRQWQDTLLVSLHNFLASIFQYMPTPTLLAYEEETYKIRKLEEKNESLKGRLALLVDKGSDFNVTPVNVDPPPHILDDFYIIAQENTTVDSQAKGLKNLIRSMGTSTSPILGRKDNSNSNKKRLSSSSNKSLKQGQSQFYEQ